MRMEYSQAGRKAKAKKELCTFENLCGYCANN